MAISICFPRKLFKKDFAIGMDGGGSCFKIAYTVPEGDLLRFNLVTFPQSDHLKAFEFIRQICDGKVEDNTEFHTCGISANKFNEDFKRITKIKPVNILEFAPMADAMLFLSEKLPWEEFVQEPSAVALENATKKAEKWQNLTNKLRKDDQHLKPYNIDKLDNLQEMPHPKHIIYPTIMFIVGSVPAPIKVYEDGRYQVVHWNPLGGKAFLGLAKTCVDAKSGFDQICESAAAGNYTKLSQMIDPGTENTTEKADSQLKASAFGHIADNFNDLEQVTKEDMAAELLSTICENTAHYSYLWSSLLGVKQVFFVGGFACSNDMIRDKISSGYLFNHLSNPDVTKTNHYYVQLGRHLGAIGTLLKNLGMN